MQLIFGWATEFARQKFSVGIDETDWQQLCAESGIGEAFMAKVPINAKYSIMAAYGRFLAEAESMRVLTDDAERAAAAERANAAREQRDEMMGTLRRTLGIDRANEPAAPAGD